MVLETIKPAVEEEDSKLARLLILIKQGDFTEARKYSDELIIGGISLPVINHNCYKYFKRLMLQSPEDAERLAESFEDYHWEAWLNEKP